MNKNLQAVHDIKVVIFVDKDYNLRLFTGDLQHTKPYTYIRSVISCSLGRQRHSKIILWKRGLCIIFSSFETKIIITSLKRVSL